MVVIRYSGSVHTSSLGRFVNRNIGLVKEDKHISIMLSQFFQGPVSLSFILHKNVKSAIRKFDSELVQ